MGKLVVLSLGEGDFQRGFPVTLQVWEEGDFHTSFLGKLPASAIDSLYDRWQSDYRQKVSGRMKQNPAQVSNRSDTDLIANSKLLKDELNNWLNSETFRPIKEKFLEKVNTRETVRVIVQTENPQLRRLPWYLWDLFESYRFAEVALSSPTFDRAHKSVQPKAKVRILAILGDSSPPDPRTGLRLNINADKQFLESMPDAEIVFLGEPKSHEFYEQLWDDRGWDILFFAGHSSSQPDGTTGKMYINYQESLTVEDLKFALKKAIERGLQLAIFNSCDGLGIARDLAELQIPQIIAMREPVPDCVAKEFLKYFLTSFSSGNILYLAVREARERLHGVEKESPCASGLPVICQNPAENSVTWQELRGIAPGINWRDACHISIPERGKLTSNSLVANDGLNLNVDDVYVPLGLVERKQKPKPDREIKPEQGSQLYGAETQYEVTKTYKNDEFAETQYEVTKTYKNDEFFEELLKQGKTDKTRGKRIAIIGEPGAGKTTLLQKIADWVLAETEAVPIWVSLADLGKFSLEDYLLQKWLKVALNVADVTLEMRQDLVTLFNHHQVWLLLDGADEMSAGNPLDQIKAQLQGWVAEARVVLTCRYNVWDAGKNALAEFDVYRNLDFDENEQIPRFIRSVFRNSDLGEKLCAKLAELENTRLRDTVKNPLRLTLLCLAWHIRQGDFTTKTQADLYAQFSEALYEWKREQFPTTSQQRRELNKALAALALRGMEEEESRFRLRQGWVREVLGETDEPLCELALQLGWINRVGVAAERPEEQVYAFYHPTFQEYFAALGMDDWRYFLNHVPDNPGLGIYRIFEKQWKQVILLWFGREDVEKEKKEEFMKALVEFQDGCYGAYQYQAYFLAAESLLEFKECNLTDKIVEQLVEYGFGDYDMSAALEKRSNRRSQDNSAAYSTVYNRYFDTIEVQAIKLLRMLDRKSVIYSITDFMVNNKNDWSTKAAQRFLTNL
jgi:energy-coupling factor transporter ATP-binding protein EcfA2